MNKDGAAIESIIDGGDRASIAFVLERQRQEQAASSASWKPLLKYKCQSCSDQLQLISLDQFSTNRPATARPSTTASFLNRHRPCWSATRRIADDSLVASPVSHHRDRNRHQLLPASSRNRPMDLNWLDVLLPRRSSSDLLWISLHQWNCASYKFSKNRTPEQIRDDVYNEPHIQILLRRSPEIRARIDKILDEMHHTWSLKAVRFVGYFLVKIMKSIYQHVWVEDHLTISSSSIYAQQLQSCRNLHDAINSLAKEAPILYMPTHRSYADFLLFSYLCYHFNLPLPSIAAGIDFLGLNQIASVLRACGAFYIRRSFKHLEDDLYWQVFRGYIHSQLRGGERPVEFFIEGTRSRNGKSLYPRTGLLSVALELFMTGQIPDLIIIPVAISYDRTLEEGLYAKELYPLQDPVSGGKKPPETTKHLLSGAKAILKQDHGSVYVRFCEPISLRDLSYQKDLRLLHTLDSRSFPNKTQTDEEIKFILNLSKLIINRQQSNFVFSPFTLAALSILSVIYGDDAKKSGLFETSFKEVLEDIKLLSLIMSQTNLNYAVQNESVEIALINSLKVHSNLIKLSTDLSTIQFDASNPLHLVQLQHYANQPMQLLFPMACFLYTSGDRCKYDRVKNVLSREFICQDDDVDEFFISQLNNEVIDSQKLNRILLAQIDFFIESYLKVGEWIFEKCQSSSLKIDETRSLVKEIQKETLLCVDVIQNALTFFLPKVLSKQNDQQADAHLKRTIDELKDLLASKHANCSLNDKLKANL